MIKQLEKEFIGTGEVKGFKFRQIQFTVHAYMYEVSKDDKLHYEIIKRLKSPICIDFEKRIYSDADFKETYPKASKFGVDAWTFKNEVDAVNKLLEVTKDEILKEESNE